MYPKFCQHTDYSSVVYMQMVHTFVMFWQWAVHNPISFILFFLMFKPHKCYTSLHNDFIYSILEHVIPKYANIFISIECRIKIPRIFDKHEMSIIITEATTWAKSSTSLLHFVKLGLMLINYM